MDSLKLISLNVRGLNDKLKCRKLTQWFKDSSFDVIFLQETYLTKGKEHIITELWDVNNSLHALSNSSHSRGVSILINPKLNAEIIDHYTCDDARTLIVNVNVRGDVICFINVYAPNKVNSRKEYFIRLFKSLSSKCLNDHMIIMAGDFNCCLQPEDRLPNSHENDYSRSSLTDLLHKYGMSDASQVLSKRPPYTWENGDGSIKSRLDYIFISEKYKTCVVSLISRFFIGCKREERLSDHKFVKVVLSKAIAARGPGYWKLNTSHICDKVYQDQIKCIIKGIQQKKSMYTAAITWELLKIEIKTFSISYSSLKARQNRERERDIAVKLEECESDDSIEARKVKESLQSELNEIYCAKARGLQIRAKVDWVEKGERNNKYFLRMEKGRQSSNVISRLEVQGKEVNDVKGVQEEIARFYEDLYTSNSVSQEEVNEYIRGIEVPRLTLVQKNDCDLQIDREELRAVIKSLKPNKSPGYDGIPAEFYKLFWDEMEDLYIDTINEAYDKEELPASLRTAILALIYKKGERTNIENYRPLSLTNIDYKILAGVLANRLKKVLPSIISTDQTGYMKGRYIGTTARLVQDIIAYSESEKVAGAVLMLDFKKAFDSLEHNFIITALQSFGFGNTLCRWIRILYSRAVFSIKNNGWIGKRICMGRGIRQGCPASGLLFVIAVELMAIKIRNNTNIHGFIFGRHGNEHKISQYVDDSTVFVRNAESIEHVIDTVSEFGKVAGPKLNIAKTEGIWLGPLKSMSKFYAGISFKNEAVKCLGIYIGHSKELCCEKNWMPKVKRIQASLEVWKTRNLTLIGKVVLLKTMALSQITYIASVMCCPDNIVKEIEKLMYNFIWSGRERVKRQTLIGGYNIGGIKMPDIRSYIEALQAVWIKKLINSKTETWAIFTKYIIHQNMGCSFEDLISTSVYESKSCPEFDNLPDFIKAAIMSFNKCKYTGKWYNSNDINKVMSSYVWGNVFIKDKGKSLWYKNWIKSGYKYVKDFIDENGAFIKPDVAIKNLKSKTNWMCEYMILKRALKEYCRNICCENSKYVNVKKTTCILYENRFYEISKLKTNVLYWFLVNQKCTSNYMEKIWTNKFKCELISRNMWGYIYEMRCFKVLERRIGIFNYKILTNSLPSPVHLSKWLPNIHPLCEICKTSDNIEHFIYGCSELQEMWNAIGKILNIMISFKDLVLGHSIYLCSLKVYNDIDVLISYVAYYTYTFKMKCKNGKGVYNMFNVINTIIAQLLQHVDIFEKTDHMLFKMAMTVIRALRKICK